MFNWLKQKVILVGQVHLSTEEQGECGGRCSRRAVLARGVRVGASPAGPRRAAVASSAGSALSAHPAVFEEVTLVLGPPSVSRRGRRHVSAPASPRRTQGL